MHENKISSDEAKYFTRVELQSFLERRFGLGINFNIRVRRFSNSSFKMHFKISAETGLTAVY